MTRPVIRTATAADAAAIQAIYAHYVETTSISFEDTPPTVAEMADRIAAQHVYLVAEEAGAVLGYAYAGRYRPRHAYRNTAEVSVYAAPTAAGRGIGTELYAALLKTLQETGFRTAIAVVTTPNPASERFHERMGFSHIGTLQDVGHKFGQWCGTALYQRALSDDMNTPFQATQAQARPTQLSDPSTVHTKNGKPTGDTP